MNPRVLELLKNPKNIQSEDLNLLKEEISSFPYIQNIRALHLYGVHLFDKENYQKELSTTAAYTTDKKILYQLINGKIQQKPKPEEIPVKMAEAVKEKVQKEEKPLIEAVKGFNAHNKFASFPLPIKKPEIKHIFANGERNRILFEGEENFLDEENNETIDIESTLESGTLVTQKAEKIESEEQNPELNKVEAVEEFTPEKIINEEKLSSETEKEEVNEASDLSFHETEPYIKEVVVPTDSASEEKEEQNSEPDNSELNKAEAVEEFTPETIINEEKISSETEKRKVDEDADLSFHETEPYIQDAAIPADKAAEEKEEQKFIPETELKAEEEILSETDDSELSFHGTESFLPDVKIQAAESETAMNVGISQPNVYKHEDEMRRLIEEVEKKMKANKDVSSAKKTEEPEILGHDISFAETQHFHVEPPKEIEEEKPAENSTLEDAVVPEEITAAVKTNTESVWKPMSLESNLPDSLLNKPVVNIQPEAETPKQEEIIPKAVEKTEEAEEKQENIEALEESKVAEPEIIEPKAADEKQEEPLVMNVSFFGSDISSLPITADKKAEEKTDQPSQVNPLDSNVPGFINTWQSWLKIDRTDEIEEEKVKTVIKNKVIESFIENNPKISQLKDEVNFVVKEKTDDISHLMTETLANLYFEQKLYTKAVNAFNILINKYPDKKEYFEEKIKVIKDMKGKS
ncbi:hypothetical protein M2347_001180 [Chryseobacterium sp. H1D6B]|uniref:tetratricopeptide repeat protein n=1 Tax=Chryseobacterium sp. H1D6B TaxID=2940588 RepID=UPI0015C84266|nr:hypothetical protein [Chryseobacterium sp. H1D6B]MDH6251453.1 hypothetical protein [Chryseobacterium sp. H1D6B]